MRAQGSEDVELGRHERRVKGVKGAEAAKRGLWGAMTLA